MRPMTATSANNVWGAFAPRDFRVKSVDTVNRERPQEMLVPSVRGVGPSAAYGTFINLAKTNWGVNRFYKTAPVATFPLRPRLKGYEHQIQTPTLLNKMPGYTNNLSMVNSQLGRMVNKGYSGQSY